MASEQKDSKGWKIVFYDGFKQRRSIRIGQATEKQAEEFSRRIGKIVSANKQGNSIDESTEKWLAKLPPTMIAKLVNAKLIEGRQSTKLRDFIGNYRAGRNTVKDSTKAKWQSATSYIVEFFKADTCISKVNSGQAEEFREFLLRKKLAENTVRRYCGIAKQFFKRALRLKLISENPFADIVATVEGNPKRFFFLELSDAAKIIEACPDAQWRLIFALCRFGGLRCASEIVQLRWEDIYWAEEKMLIHSPKTAHHKGKETRVIPLFRSIRPHLEEVFQQRSKDAVHVITRYRSPKQNLRTTFEKIILRAGLQPWPKLFQNLRSSRQTELIRQGNPVHVVCSWMGNSKVVADKHYHQLDDTDFRRALANDSAQQVGTMVGTNPASGEELGGKPPLLLQENPRRIASIQGSSTAFVSVPNGKMGDEGLEPPAISGLFSEHVESGGNHGGHSTLNRDVDELLNLWDKLSEISRESLLVSAMHLLTHESIEICDSRPLKCNLPDGF